MMSDDKGIYFNRHWSGPFLGVHTEYGYIKFSKRLGGAMGRRYDEVNKSWDFDDEITTYWLSGWFTEIWELAKVRAEAFWWGGRPESEWVLNKL